MKNCRHDIGKDKSNILIKQSSLEGVHDSYSFIFRVARKTVQVNNTTAYFSGFLYTFLGQSLIISSHGWATCSVSALPEIV